MAQNPALKALSNQNKKRGSVFNQLKISPFSSSKRSTMLPTSGSPFTERKEHLSECGFDRRTSTLPPIVEQTCVYLEQHALQVEGLFRIPGSSEDIRKIKDKFEKGKKINLNKELNPHTVAGVLKLFFTELPNPILTYELYSSFMAATEIKDINLRLACIRKVFDRLPIGNREVVKRVTAMFHIISSFNEDNKMTSRNIALVMNANMFRGRDQSIQNFMSTGGMRCRLIEHMIDNHDELFVQPKEILENYLTQETTMEVKLQIERFFLTLRNDSIVLASALVSEGETEIKISFDEVSINISKSEIEEEEDSNNNNGVEESSENNNNNNNNNLVNANNIINLIGDELKEKYESANPQTNKTRRRQGIKINVKDIKAALQSEGRDDNDEEPAGFLTPHLTSSENSINEPTDGDNDQRERSVTAPPEIETSEIKYFNDDEADAKEIASINNLDLDDMVQQLLSGDADQVYATIESLNFEYRATMYEHLKQMLADLVSNN